MTENCEHCIISRLVPVSRNERESRPGGETT